MALRLSRYNLASAQRNIHLVLIGNTVDPLNTPSPHTRRPSLHSTPLRSASLHPFISLVLNALNGQVLPNGFELIAREFVILLLRPHSFDVLQRLLLTASQRVMSRGGEPDGTKHTKE